VAALGTRNRTGPVGRSYNEGVNSNKETPSNNKRKNIYREIDIDIDIDTHTHTHTHTLTYI